MFFRYLFMGTILGFSVSGGEVGASEAITEVCVGYGYEEGVCECATEVLTSSINAENLTVYSEVSSYFTERLDAGESIVDAWDASVSEYAEASGMSFVQVLEITNPIGRANNEAIASCE